MLVVTGAAGFIGSCVVSKLNSDGKNNLILVDNLLDGSQERIALKKNNLTNKKYVSYFDKKDFLNLVINDKLDFDVEAIIHMGACSSTTFDDAKYFEENNLEYTKSLAKYTLKNNIRFIYASSAATYGDGSIGYKDDVDTILKCKPLNLYGLSKQKFDEWVLENDYLDKVVGLKFFNVFGPNEYHKEDMRSVVAKAYNAVVKEGKMKLFKSYNKEYRDGQQKRDFVYVKDAVSVVMFFLNNPQVNGIFNVGSAKARTWIDLANSLFLAVGQKTNIEYVEMPESLRDKYQYFTQADMKKLFSAGYSKTFYELEDSVKDYVKYLKNNKCL